MLMSALKPLAELETGAEFVARHIGIDADAEVRGKRQPMRVATLPFAPHHYFRG